MASRNIHNLVNKIFLGDDYRHINSIIDAPISKYGKNHRQVFGHHLIIDPLLLGIRFKDPKVGIAVILHQTTDLISTKIKKELRK